MALIFIGQHSLNVAFRQCKLHNIFIFGMAYQFGYFCNAGTCTVLDDLEEKIFKIT